MIRPGQRWLSTAAAAVLLLSAGALAAHDFWVIPDAFQVAAGGALAIRGQTSSAFPTSGSAVAPERVAEARLIGALSDERMTDLSTSGRSLLIRHRPAGAGQRIVAVALVERSARTTPEQLKRYIALEGAPQLADRYEREGLYPRVDSLTRVSAKFAKTVVDVGSGGPRAFDRVVGHVLEIVPLTDPSQLRAGDTLVVRLLYRGQPAAGAHLHAGAAPAGSTVSDTARAGTAASADISAETGSDGTARIVVREAGLWNVRLVHGGPVPGGTVAAPEWEVHFATLVFSVAGAAPHRH